MKSYFAYIRVSTTRQGEEGVSLPEQKRAILEFASKRGMTISAWFEDQITATKRGRPAFNKLVGLLKHRKAAGIIIHKIDRGTRNLHDWADMGELIDCGIEVHFTHENIDLHTRGGRLSADILAVVAADYVRNLREETIKGINGRLRQGLYPFAAPVGYVNNGKGKPKTINPVIGPLVKQAFELHASRQYSLTELQNEMFRRGLRTRTGGIVYLSQLATILRNPFYIGLITFKGRKDTYPGIHEPLITSSLFNTVQHLLDGNRTYFRQNNRFLFRLFMRCECCKLYLVGERQKGHVYYRCHRRCCPPTSFREELVEKTIRDALKGLNISSEEEPIISQLLSEFRERESEIRRRLKHEAEEELARIQSSMRTLMDKFLDGQVPKSAFDETHALFLMRRKLCEDKLGSLDSQQNLHAHLEAFLGLLRSIDGKFSSGSPEQARKIMERVFVEIAASGKALRVIHSPLMERIAARQRTRESWNELFSAIIKDMAQNMGSGSNFQVPSCF